MSCITSSSTISSNLFLHKLAPVSFSRAGAHLSNLVQYVSPAPGATSDWPVPRGNFNANAVCPAYREVLNTSAHVPLT